MSGGIILGDLGVKPRNETILRFREILKSPLGDLGVKTREYRTVYIPGLQSKDKHNLLVTNLLEPKYASSRKLLFRGAGGKPGRR